MANGLPQLHYNPYYMQPYGQPATPTAPAQHWNGLPQHYNPYYMPPYGQPATPTMPLPVPQPQYYQPVPQPQYYQPLPQPQHYQPSMVDMQTQAFAKTAQFGMPPMPTPTLEGTSFFNAVAKVKASSKVIKPKKRKKPTDEVVHPKIPPTKKPKLEHTHQAQIEEGNGAGSGAGAGAGSGTPEQPTSFMNTAADASTQIGVFTLSKRRSSEKDYHQIALTALAEANGNADGALIIKHIIWKGLKNEFIGKAENYASDRWGVIKKKPIVKLFLDEIAKKIVKWPNNKKTYDALIALDPVLTSLNAGSGTAAAGSGTGSGAGAGSGKPEADLDETNKEVQPHFDFPLPLLPPFDLGGENDPLASQNPEDWGLPPDKHTEQFPGQMQADVGVPPPDIDLDPGYKFAGNGAGSGAGAGSGTPEQPTSFMDTAADASTQIRVFTLARKRICEKDYHRIALTALTAANGNVDDALIKKNINWKGLKKNFIGKSACYATYTWSDIKKKPIVKLFLEEIANKIVNWPDNKKTYDALIALDPVLTSLDAGTGAGFVTDAELDAAAGSGAGAGAGAGSGKPEADLDETNNEVLLPNFDLPLPPLPPLDIDPDPGYKSAGNGANTGLDQISFNGFVW